MLAHAEVADKVASQGGMLLFLGILFLFFLLVVKVRSHFLLWPYAAFLLFCIVGEIDFIMIDDEVFHMAINELGSSYRYAVYAHLVSLLLLLILTFYFFSRSRATRR
ncbi:MAG: hypothetical protein JJU25_05665 [Halomonas sp.]|nr:hypothetical protein [Halomonas sp.]